MNEPLITRELLDEFGIELGNQDEASLLEHLNSTLEERVGTEITESLDEPQLKELVELQEKGTDEEIAVWLEKNVPDLQEITQDEIDILIGELAENSDAITTK
jgi:hypothetical protein